MRPRDQGNSPGRVHARCFVFLELVGLSRICFQLQPNEPTMHGEHEVGVPADGLLLDGEVSGAIEPLQKRNYLVLPELCFFLH